MSADYRVRPATLDDADVLVRHRIGMFTDMGVPLDKNALGEAFRAWLRDTMPSGTYRAWLVETGEAGVVAGGGITILPWPPGPRYAGDRLAFVYNVYTEPAHRRRGLARSSWTPSTPGAARPAITSMALNASRDGQPLYESMGYAVAPSPMMFLPLTRAKHSLAAGRPAAAARQPRQRDPVNRLDCRLVPSRYNPPAQALKGRPGPGPHNGDARACHSSSLTRALKRKTPPAWTCARWTASTRARTSRIRAS